MAVRHVSVKENSPRMSIIKDKVPRRRATLSQRTVSISKPISSSSSSSTLSARFSTLKPKPKARLIPSSKRNAKKFVITKKKNIGRHNNKFRKRAAAPSKESLDAALDSFMMKDPSVAKEKLNADIDAYMKMEVESTGNLGQS